MKPVIAAVATSFLLVGCGGGGEGGDAAGGGGEGTAPQCVDVTAETSPVVLAVDNEFDPSCLVVGEGQDLTVRNDGMAAHTFTLDEADIQLVIQPGEEEVAEGVGDAVPAGGEVEFVCEFHPGMAGTLRTA